MGNGIRKGMRSVLRILGALAAILAAIWMLLAQPSCRRNPVSQAFVDPAKLREHVEMLSQRFHPRDFRYPAHLEQIADYIAGQFEQAGATVEFQSFTAAGNSYRNVIGRFQAGTGDKTIVGAHYDACGPMPGADDNASGIAALIELARLLGERPPASEVELVAYCLEEPPFFQTDEMGSAIHARSVANDKARIRGVIVLEMVGCFSDRWGSQSYPSPLLHLIYPNRGNFIGVIGRWDQGGWIQAVKAGMQGRTGLAVRSIRAPGIVPGIDLSDHRNYWPQGIPALMVTDTAFYRNPAYHTFDDTADRLDYHRMSQVVVALFEAVESLCRLSAAGDQVRHDGFDVPPPIGIASGPWARFCRADPADALGNITSKEKEP